MRGNITLCAIVSVGAILLAACSQNPMSALQSDTINQTYNSTYWAKERDANTALWQEALAYCKTYPDKVNCKPVHMSLFFGGSTTPLPGKAVSLPSFGQTS